MNNKIIVKIQQAAYPPDGPLLIYDESREWLIQDFITPEIKAKLKIAPKSFYYAQLIRKPKTTPFNNPLSILKILHQAPWQLW